MKRWNVLLLVVVLVFTTGILAVGVGAQAGPGDSPVATPLVPPDPIDPGTVPDLPAFLELLAGPTGWVVIGVLVSMVLSCWTWYNNQPSVLKQLIPIVISILVSTAARLLLTFVPESVWARLAPYWVITAGAIMTWVGSQGWYQIAVRPKKVLPERVWKV